MTATNDLIALLDDIGQREDGLGFAARGHSRRLKRPLRYLRTREDHLHALEGFMMDIRGLLPKVQLTYQADRNKGSLLLVLYVVNLRFIFSMILSQPLTIKPTGCYEVP